MDAITFIREIHKPFIGEIDYDITDEYGKSYWDYFCEYVLIDYVKFDKLHNKSYLEIKNNDEYAIQLMNDENVIKHIDGFYIKGTFDIVINSCVKEIIFKNCNCDISDECKEQLKVLRISDSINLDEYPNVEEVVCDDFYCYDTHYNVKKMTCNSNGFDEFTRIPNVEYLTLYNTIGTDEEVMFNKLKCYSGPKENLRNIKSSNDYYYMDDKTSIALRMLNDFFINL